MNFGRDTSITRILYIMAALTLILSFSVRGYWVATGPINEDETDTLQKAWLMDHGQKMYLDYFAVRMPLAFQSVRPFLWFTDRPSTILFSARIFQVLLTAVLFAFLFLFSDIIAGRRAALWALILAACFNYFAERTVQVRAEPLMLLLTFAGLWLSARWRVEDKSPAYLFIAGLLFGLAVMTKISAVFPAVGLAAFILWDTVREPTQRRSSLIGLGLLTLGGFLAFAAVMFWTCGAEAVQAVVWMVMSAGLLRFSEQFRGGSWFLVRTLFINAVFWATLLFGFAWLHLRWAQGRQSASRLLTQRLLMLLGWSGVLSLVARKVLFQQDLLLPALLLAPAGGLLLASRVRINAMKKSHLPSVRVIVLLVLMLGFFIGETVLKQHHINLTIRYHNQVLASFWQGTLPEGPPVRVDNEKLFGFLRGEYDRIHYYPNRTTEHDLKLADTIARLTDKNETVFTDAGLPIKRREPHRIIKATVFEHYAQLEAPAEDPRCLSLVRFIPCSCMPDITPGERLRLTLVEHDVKLVLIGYGTAAVLAKYPETTGWFFSRYDTWYDPQLNALIALPAGETWNPLGG